MTTYLTIDVAAGISIGVTRVALDDLSAMDVLAQYESADTRRHAENLTPMVQAALAEAGIAAPDAVIAGTGPAAFTGLRAGLVTARTLAHVWQVPIYGLSSLEALALGGMDAGANVAAPIIDARRKEIYTLRARAMGPDDLAVLEEERVLAPQDLARELSANPAVIVKHEADVDLYADVFADYENAIVKLTSDVWVRLLLSRQSRAAAGETGAALDFSTTPHYLRRPDVHAGAHSQLPATGNPYEMK